MRRRWVPVALVVVATGSVAGLALARSGPAPNAPHTSGWWSYPPLEAATGRRHLGTGTAGPRRVVVAPVTTLDLDVAYARLHRVGLRVSYRHSFSVGTALNICEPTIVRQSPGAGRTVSTGTVVELSAQPPRCSVGSPGVPVGRLPSATVPDFAGQPITDAAAWAERHELFWQL